MTNGLFSLLPFSFTLLLPSRRLKTMGAGDFMQAFGERGQSGGGQHDKRLFVFPAKAFHPQAGVVAHQIQGAHDGVGLCHARIELRVATVQTSIVVDKFTAVFLGEGANRTHLFRLSLSGR